MDLDGLPALPLLIVLFSLLGRRHCEQGIDGIWASTTVYGKLTIGDATNASGVCKIISGLLKIFRWTEECYRTQFENIDRWCPIQSDLTTGQKIQESYTPIPIYNVFDGLRTQPAKQVTASRLRKQHSYLRNATTMQSAWSLPPTLSNTLP